MESHFDPWAFIVGNLFIAVLVWFVAFGFFAIIAAWVAPPARRLRRFLLTLFFLGPWWAPGCG
jgi:hypothetical protein